MGLNPVFDLRSERGAFWLIFCFAEGECQTLRRVYLEWIPPEKRGFEALDVEREEAMRARRHWKRGAPKGLRAVQKWVWEVSEGMRTV